MAEKLMMTLQVNIGKGFLVQVKEGELLIQTANGEVIGLKMTSEQLERLANLILLKLRGNSR
jgi:hypothetical protein